MEAIFRSGFLAAGSFQLMAQQTADVQFNVMLADVQSIRVDQNQHHVSIVLDNVAEFSQGKVVQQADHLRITSSSEYEIKVSASSQLQGNNAVIPSAQYSFRQVWAAWGVLLQFQ